jgi:hypothetical protein
MEIALNFVDCLLEIESIFSIQIHNHRKNTLDLREVASTK